MDGIMDRRLDMVQPEASFGPVLPVSNTDSILTLVYIGFETRKYYSRVEIEKG